jgi:hypothetical protein
MTVAARPLAGMRECYAMCGEPNGWIRPGISTTYPMLNDQERQVSGS